MCRVSTGAIGRARLSTVPVGPEVVAASYAGAPYAFRRMAELSHGAFEQEFGLLLYHCGVPDPVVWNGAIVTDATSVGPNELLQRADAFFSARTDSYGFWVVSSRDAALARF